MTNMCLKCTSDPCNFFPSISTTGRDELLSGRRSRPVPKTRLIEIATRWCSIDRIMKIFGKIFMNMNSKPAYQKDLTTFTSDFECSLCFQTIYGQIYSCNTGGHLVCEICKPKWNQCATCSQPTDCRLRHSEYLRDNTLVECHCSQKIVGKDFAAHLPTCTALPKECPCCHCTVMLADMEAHLKKHGVFVFAFEKRDTFFTAGIAPFVIRTAYENEELKDYDYNSHVPGLGHLWVAKRAPFPQLFKYDVSCDLHFDELDGSLHQLYVSNTPLLVQVHATKQIVISLFYKEDKKYQFELYRQDGSLLTYFVVPGNCQVQSVSRFHSNESVVKMTIRCATPCVDSVSSSEC